MIIVLILTYFCSLNQASTDPTPSCPDGFSVLNNDVCVKLFTTPAFYKDASDNCKSFTGGNLVSVHNAIDNRKLVNLATAQGHTHPVWLGLTCSDADSQYTLCTWDDDTGFTTVYSNFANYYPSIDIGTNVYILTSGNSAGQWVSSDGTIQTLAYFCEVPTDNRMKICPNELNGFCYFLNMRTPYVDESGAREYCQKECGDLVSIHSDDENTQVSSLFPRTSTWNQVRIGAKSEEGGEHYWADGTEFDYCNFGYFNFDIGNCSTLSIYRDVTPPRQWASSSCNDKIPFVCKRAKYLTSCAPNPARREAKLTATCPPNPTNPPSNPYMCNQSQIYSRNGTIYSPYYPQTFSPLVITTCTYVITAPKGSIVQVQFSNETFISYSRIDLYSQLMDGKTFGSFTGYPPSSPFVSTTNVIKMVFTVSYGNHGHDEKWVATYGNQKI